MKPHQEFTKFIAPYDDGIQELTLELRNFITGLVPQANELIWDNYNAVALAYSKSERLKDAFCHIAVYSKHVNFGFNRGAELTSGTLILNGKGKLIRHIAIKDIKSFPMNEIRVLIWEAVGLSEKRNSELTNKQTQGKSRIMSISKKKLRPTKKD